MSYLYFTMLRKLLTLFVLLSGLAAVGAPAHARVAAFDEVRLEASSQFGTQRIAPHHQRALHLGQGHQKVWRGQVYHPTATIAVRVPAVMLGVDRARE